MKRSISFIVAFLMTVFLSNSVFAQIKSDYDKSVDFSKYKTYTFASWQKDSDKQLDFQDKKSITNAIRAELAERGLTLVKSDGDAIFTLYVVVKKEAGTTAYNNYIAGMGFGPLWGWGLGAGTGSVPTIYTENDYKVGALVVDMYDEGNRNLIWQGIITAIVKKKPEQRNTQIPREIKKMMKGFPIKAKK